MSRGSEEPPRTLAVRCKSVYTSAYSASAHDASKPPRLQMIRPVPRGARGTARAGAARRGRRRADPAAGDTATQRIVDSITTAIVERRLMPGTKLAEQKLADIFRVSRTLVRQALNQLSRDRLVSSSRRAAPSSPRRASTRRARCSRCAACSRRAMITQLASQHHAGAARRAARPPAGRTRGGAAHRRLRPHAAAGRLPRRASRAHARQRGAGADAARPGVALLADLADVPVVAFGRSTRTTNTWRSSTRWSARDARAAVRLMDEHLRHVEHNLRLDPRRPRPGDIGR